MRLVAYFLLFVLSINAFAPLAHTYFVDESMEIVELADFGEEEKQEMKEKAEKLFQLMPQHPDFEFSADASPCSKSAFSQVIALISRLHAFELDMPPELTA
jgi:hypothetical protein